MSESTVAGWASTLRASTASAHDVGSTASRPHNFQLMQTLPGSRGGTVEGSESLCSYLSEGDSERDMVAYLVKIVNEPLYVIALKAATR